MDRPLRALQLAALAFVTLTTLAVQARDGGTSGRHDGPCRGCRSSYPGGSDPLPLLVLLHGDGEAVGPTFDLWESAAARRHVAVLALACPRSLGCSPNSWWQWNHDPAWITEQIAKLAELRPIDKKRLWLVGWSGGASYAGYRTLEIEPSFAAIVIHGGGMPPSTAACSTVRAPIYFLVSDRNPLHSLAQGLRDHYQACGNDVTWTLVHAPNHEDERSALGQYREAIFDWLATKQLAEIVTAMSDASPSPTSDASLTQAPAAPSPALEPLPRSHASCRCILGGVSNNDTGPMALTLGVLAALWIRRRPISSRPCGSARGRDESGSRALR